MAKKASDEELLRSYAELSSVWKVGEAFGMCGQSVHERLVKLGAIKANRWTEQEVAYLAKNYSDYANSGRLQELADYYGRNKANVCRKARELGLTDQKREKPYMSEAVSMRQKEWHQKNEHPRGFQGRKHTAESKKKISEKSIRTWKNFSKEQINDMINKRIKTSHINGTLYGTNREKASWKAAWREIGGTRKYYRSRWEANYARYLESLKLNGEIKNWEHEPETFWFEGIKRGCVSYLPDFRVTLIDGSIEYHEVKGWMDDKSKTKIKRMAKYHPNVKLIVIDAKKYRSLERSVKKNIEGWE